MSMKNSRYLSWRIRFFAVLMLVFFLVFVLLAGMVAKNDTARLFLSAAAGILVAAALLTFHYMEADSSAAYQNGGRIFSRRKVKSAGGSDAVTGFRKSHGKNL